jgi:hypothetical protein
VLVGSEDTRGTRKQPGYVDDEMKELHR